MKNIGKKLGVIGSVCSIIGLGLYFFSPNEKDVKSQSNKATIRNSDSATVDQYNSSVADTQENEVLIDSSKNVQVKQTNK